MNTIVRNILALLFYVVQSAFIQDNRGSAICQAHNACSRTMRTVRSTSRKQALIQRDGAEIHDITYPSPVQGRVNAFLVVPKGKGPFAGIVFGHWGHGTRSEFLPDAMLYAKAGAVSLLIDYPWDRTGSSRRTVDNIDKPAQDLEAFTQAVVDARRGIDLLIARKNVDPNRIAYVGHSFGAQWGAILPQSTNG